MHRRSRADIKADIETWEGRLTKAGETLAEISESVNQQNAFSSADASQSARRRSLKSQSDYVDYIETKLRRLYAELHGGGGILIHRSWRDIT